MAMKKVRWVNKHEKNQQSITEIAAKKEIKHKNTEQNLMLIFMLKAFFVSLAAFLFSSTQIYTKRKLPNAPCKRQRERWWISLTKRKGSRELARFTVQLFPWFFAFSKKSGKSFWFSYKKTSTINSYKTPSSESST